MNCPLKIINPFNHGSLRIDRQIQYTGKTITKQGMGKEEILRLSTTIAFYAVLLLHLVFVYKPPDLLSLAFPPLEQFDNTDNDYLQLMKEKRTVSNRHFVGLQDATRTRQST